MAAQCKFCGDKNVTWVRPFPDSFPDTWVLVDNVSETRHDCKEYFPKKKIKHGVFLRLYGPHAAKTHAVMVQTKDPDPDTPEGMYKELKNEFRRPVFYYLAKGK